MTPNAKRRLVPSLILIIIVVIICLTPPIRSWLTGIVRSWFTEVELVKPGTDNFEDAEVISGPAGSIERINTAAVAQPGEPNHRGLPPCKSIWFRWTAPNEGGVTFDTQNSAIDTVLAVYDADSLQAIPNSPKIILNRDNDYRQFVFNAKKDRTYRIVVNGRDCGTETNKAAATPEPKASSTPADAAAAGSIQMQWQMESFNFSNLIIKGRIKDANCQDVTRVTLTISPCTTGCVENTNTFGRYVFNGYPVGGIFTITPSFNDYNFIPEPGEFTQSCRAEAADVCTWIPGRASSCQYPQNTGNLLNANYRAYRNPTLTFLPAETKDLVGQGNSATSSNGEADGVFRLHFPNGSAHPQQRRRITKIELHRNLGGVWDTDATTGFWVLGLTDSINGSLLNNPDGSLGNSIMVDNGSTWHLFAADRSLSPYFQYGIFTVIISFADGGVATASFDIAPTPSPTTTAAP